MAELSCNYYHGKESEQFHSRVASGYYCKISGELTKLL